MTAEITYNTGRSYKLGKYKFVQGVTLQVHDPAVIERCANTTGFSVRILEKKKPKKRIQEKITREVVEAEMSVPKKKGVRKDY